MRGSDRRLDQTNKTPKYRKTSYIRPYPRFLVRLNLTVNFETTAGWQVGWRWHTFSQFFTSQPGQISG